MSKKKFGCALLCLTMLVMHLCGCAGAGKETNTLPTGTENEPSTAKEASESTGIEQPTETPTETSTQPQTEPQTEAQTEPAPDLFHQELNAIFAENHVVGVANQGESAVQFYDLSLVGDDGILDSDCIVWEYKTSEFNIADLKLRDHPVYGKVVLIAYGVTSACMVSYTTKEVLWRTSSAPQNPHAVELIPADSGWVIGVAGSTGAALRFFDASQKVGISFTQIDYEDAHGLLYDPAGGVCWALGKRVLSAYSVQLENGKPTVTLQSDMVYTTPKGSGHDLQPVYNDTNKLWITNTKGVYIFDKKTGEFSAEYAGNETLNVKNVKATGNFMDNSGVIMITPDAESVVGVYPQQSTQSGFPTWTSNYFKVGYYAPDGTVEFRTYVCNKGAFYKVRILCSLYQ